MLETSAMERCSPNYQNEIAHRQRQEKGASKNRSKKRETVRIKQGSHNPYRIDGHRSELRAVPAEEAVVGAG